MTSWELPSAEAISIGIDNALEGSVTAPATTVISGANDDAVSLNVGDGRLEDLVTTSAGPPPPSQVVLILCGLIASGKSTFAEQLQVHFPEFRRCNQDDLGDRRRVEQLARDSLADGHSVCIDRTNFNASQRFHWIKIAREFPGTQIWVIIFDTPYEVCAARLKARTGHPTITNPEQGLSVLSRFASDFEYPQDYEGYHHILYLKPLDHPTPEYGQTDIAAILQRVRDSPPVTRAHQSRQGELAPAHASRGPPGYQGGRGRGRGYPPSQQRGSGWRGGGPTYNYQRPAPEQPLAYRGGWQGGLGHSSRGWRDRPSSGNNTDVQ